jgi:hypothetical protein
MDAVESKTVRRFVLRLFHSRFRIAGAAGLVLATILLFLLLRKPATSATPTINSSGGGSVSGHVDISSGGVIPKRGGLPTIFVSIASYRDNRCQNTITELFKKAKHPERIFVGIVQQNNAAVDKDCAAPEILAQDFIPKDHVRIWRVNYREARGPCWARHAAIEKHYRDEDYVFQIDSHLLFTQDWDQVLVTDHQSLPPKSTLSHYPHSYEDGVGPPQDHANTMPFLCSGNYGTDPEIMVPGGAVHHIEPGKFPRETQFMAAGFMFFPGIALKEVPYDPYLPFLFVGEELTFSVRFAAKGWRFFSPSKNVCFHFYGRKESPHFWDQSDRHPDYDYLNRRSRERINYILGIQARMEVKNATYTLRESVKYGIDYNNPEDVFNLDRYYRRFEIDFKKRSAGDFCNKLPPPF